MTATRVENRPHGRTKYTAEKCRCDTCRAANREYQSRRVRQRLYGIEAYVDAAPVRAHVATLQASGLGIKRIGEVSGVTKSVMKKLVYGDPARGQQPLKRMRPDNAAAILAVRPDPSLLREQRNIDGTGTRRRLQALVALGWPQSDLAIRIPMQPTNLSLLLRSRNVQVRTARTVARIYDELCWVIPPANTPEQARRASRARRHAERRGWVPPLAWDDDAIDDPAATPQLDSGITYGARFDVDELVREHGPRPPREKQEALVENFARRHGVTPAAVHRAINRRRAADEASADFWLAS